MESRKALEKYLKASNATLIAAIICAALCVACIVGAAVSEASYVKPQAEPFYPAETPVGDYAYIDAVLVSNWLYKTDSGTYYSVMDADRYWYTACLSDTQFAAMSAQYNYFMTGTEDDPAPDAYRISGLCARASSEIAEALANAWSMQDADEYYTNFGPYYLNATSQPSSDTGGIFMLVALFSGLMALFMFLSALPKNRTTKKCLARLDSLGLLDAAADQLTAPDNVAYRTQNIMLSRDFVYSPASGAVLRYEDIFWSFMRIQRIYFIKSAETLVAAAAFCGQVNLAVNPVGKKYAGTLEQIMQQMAQRNPQMRLGFVRDNIDAFNAYRKQEKAASKN
ncbi:MAG: hypothetical protein VB092_02050 [Oscillospiraceae bacterium]|nr:hypothetical protein [Oscillospiraceae bacterium]